MKLTRQQFLRVLPVTVLALSGCAASETAPASTEELVFDHACPLDYATQFTADCYEGGYTMLTLTESGEQFLVTPEDAAAVEGLPESVTVLQHPPGSQGTALPIRSGSAWYSRQMCIRDSS